MNCQQCRTCFFLKQHMDRAMKMTYAKHPLEKGRSLFISLICIMIFMGVTGFGPLPSREGIKSQSTPTDTFSYADNLDSFISHNLTIDTTELRCLALNIYWESRSESLMGQLAVAGVTMNRVADKKFPNTICGVVKQGNEARLHRCQFSWWCDGQKDDPKEIKAWSNAQQIARLFQAGIYSDPTGHALWYHADYVAPYWAKTMKQTARIGRHLFFKTPPSTRSKAS